MSFCADMLKSRGGDCMLKASHKRIANEWRGTTLIEADELE